MIDTFTTLLPKAIFIVTALKCNCSGFNQQTLGLKLSIGLISFTHLNQQTKTTGQTFLIGGSTPSTCILVPLISFLHLIHIILTLPSPLEKGGERR